MKIRSLLPSCFGLCALLCAHPMGNFSVSHYAHLKVSAQGVEMRYALDLAEIPSFELLRDWKLSDTSLRAVREQTALIERKAAEQAREWVRHLDITANGRPVAPRFEGANVTVSEGAGQMPILRITARLHLSVKSGQIQYADHNYEGRAGWKEIVIAAGDGASVAQASQGSVDRSKALTEYPQDPLLAPPQDLRAAIEWTILAQASAKEPVVIAAIPQPKSAMPAAIPPSSAKVPQTSPAGTVVRGDFLSRMLGSRNITWTMMLFGIAAAFGLGAMHALSPGHGKTIVAAYLVGARGTMKHAAFLGAMVTFTHTVSVFLLGLGTLFLAQYIVPDKIYPVLGAVSGLSIAFIGASLFVKRLRKMSPAPAAAHAHSHDHDHVHSHDHHQHDHHHHDHDHDGHHDHAHDHHDHGHDHGPHGHSHVPEGDITLASLIALGASGGLVPCPSALVLLLSSIALGHVGLGLFLLVGFSLGLSAVLIAIGAMVVYAKHWLPDSQKAASHPAFRLIPVISAAVIVCVGLVMTGVSLGWVQPMRLIS